MSRLQNDSKLSKSIFTFSKFPVPIFLIFLMLSTLSNVTFAQVEVEPWGNMAGIRVGGQLIPFETKLSLVSNNWSVIKSTGQERQQPKYRRDGNKQTITTKIDSVSFIETIEDSKQGTANVNVSVFSNGVVKND